MPVNGDEMHEPEPDEVIVSGAPSRSEIRARRRALRQSKRDRAARELDQTLCFVCSELVFTSVVQTTLMSC